MNKVNISKESALNYMSIINDKLVKLSDEEKINSTIRNRRRESIEKLKVFIESKDSVSRIRKIEKSFFKCWKGMVQELLLESDYCGVSGFPTIGYFSGIRDTNRSHYFDICVIREGRGSIEFSFRGLSFHSGSCGISSMIDDRYRLPLLEIISNGGGVVSAEWLSEIRKMEASG